ncbi:MAG TPA: YbaB/EbfC family nucleoid-associated protein [Iamia sp.]|nr:YbaB/EbfC family nucleoid-associated protein [Iamia sp.]
MTDTPPPHDETDDEDGPTASGPSIPAQLVGADGIAVGPLDEDTDDDPFDLGNLLGGGGLDLGSLMEQASQMQQQMAEAQAAAATTLLEGVAGGGAVKVTVTGTGEFQSIHIDPGAVDPDDVAMLEDLVLAALRDATARIQELQAGAMGGLGDLLGGQ